MTKFSYRTFGLAAAFLVTAASAQAQGKGHDKGHDKGHGKAEKELRRDDRDDRDERDERGVRDRRLPGGVIVRDGRDVYGNGTKVPPGLAKKPGQMPPGQYKKRYSTAQGSSVLRDILIGRGYNVVRTDNAGDRQYVFYRTPDGRLRRAVVSPGADRLEFSNVPSSLLREVLGRLY